MPDIHPPPTLAQYCHQGFIYPRRVFHISSPVTGMAESIPQSAPLGNTPSNLFCQSTSIRESKELIDGINAIAEQIVTDSELLENIKALFKRVVDVASPNDLDELLRIITVSLDDKEQERRGGAVNIMTMHQAKGLTATAVFVVGAEDEYIPGRAQGKEVDDERRLLYVSLTRARHYLYITHCHSRINQQQHTGRNPNVPHRKLTQFLSGGPIKSESGAAYIERLS